MLSLTQTALKYPTPNEIGSEFLSGLNASLIVAKAQGCSRSHCQRESRRVETVTLGDEGWVPIQHQRRGNDEEVSQFQVYRWQQGVRMAHKWPSGQSGTQEVLLALVNENHQ